MKCAKKNNAILDRKYNFLKIYSIFKLEENSQDGSQAWYLNH